jgi:hypothetical protein
VKRTMLRAVEKHLSAQAAFIIYHSPASGPVQRTVGARHAVPLQMIASVVHLYIFEQPMRKDYFKSM